MMGFTQDQENLATPTLTVSPYPSEAPSGLKLTLGDTNETLRRKLTIVVIGSSSAKGEGASDLAHSWVELLKASLPAYSASIDVQNIAHGGYGSYQFRETGFVPPAGYPLPDPECNVTKALSFNPDIVIFANAGNDIVTGGYDIATEIVPNYQAIKTLVEASGAMFIPTTTQPRTGTNIVRRTNLETLSEYVKSNFDTYINFFDNLVWRTPENTTTNLTALTNLRYDDTHFNDAGHQIMFEQALAVISSVINETARVDEYVIERSQTAVSGYTELTTLTPFQTIYQDNSAVANTTYYYRIKAKALAPRLDSYYSTVVSSMVPGIQLLQTVYFNFGASTIVVPQYNNIGISSADISLLNSLGTSSGLKIKTPSFSTVSNGETVDMGTGYSFPSEAMRTALNNTAARSITVTGRAGKKYKLVLFGSRSNASSATAPRETIWTIGSETHSLECFQNKTQTVTFGATESTRIALNGSDQFIVTVTPGAGGQAYTNCGVLYEYGTP